EVKPALGGVQVRDVGHPDLVRAARRWLLWQQVWGGTIAVCAVGRARPPPRLFAALQTLAFHQASAPALADTEVLLAQLLHDPRRTIRAPAARMRLCDLLRQRLVLLFAPA